MTTQTESHQQETTTHTSPRLNAIHLALKYFRYKDVLMPNGYQKLVAKYLRDSKPIWHFGKGPITVDRKGGICFLGLDFLNAPPLLKFDLVIGILPKDDYLPYAQKMYECCGHGGKVIAICPYDFKTGGGDKRVLRNWLDTVPAALDELPSQILEFEEGFGAPCLITIHK